MDARRRSWNLLCLSLLLATLTVALAGGAQPGHAAGAGGLELSAPAFPASGDIPARFSCEGADVSPALRWTSPPNGTRSFALIVEDPDAPGGVFTHWVLYDLPGGTRELPEGVPQRGDFRGARQGRNDFDKPGYGGPCPPPGAPHRYVFTLYALDRRVGLPGGASRAEVEKALEGHVLAQAALTGRFKR